MPEGTQLTVFLVAAAVLLITPGPAVLYIVTRSIDQGRTAGVVSVLGIATGTMVHVGAAALGISVILVASALAFSVLKYLGAAYLIYLGIRRILNSNQLQQAAPIRRRALREIFLEGVVVNLLNPKTALFLFAFLPQFVDPARGPASTQVLLLGMILVGMGLASDGLYALTAGTLGHRLRGSLRFVQAQRYLAGGVYLALGVATAVSGATSRK